MEAEESAAAATNTKEEIEAEITKAMLSRVADFRKQADNLTLEGVRRALEKDLGMQRLSLDAHKKFIKQCVEKYFYGADAKDASETEEKTGEDPIQIVEGGDMKKNNSDLNETFGLEGSPLGELEQADHATEKSSGHDIEANEDTIKKAIKKRAAYFRANLEITLLKVRRLLEEDLKLEKGRLDAHKKFISNELDAIFQSSETVEATNGAKKEPKKTSKKRVVSKPSKGTKKASRDLCSSDSDDAEEEDEEIKKPKRQPAQNVKGDTSFKRRKISTERTKSSGKKKPVDEDSEKSDEEEEDEEFKKKGDTSFKKQKISTERSKSSGKKKPKDEDSEKSDESDGGKSSEDDRSQSSGEEEEVQKRMEKPAQLYGKQVEHLKTIIKACGIGIPPSIYKRVKQAPESKREAHLIKELEEILEKEGLSTNPSEKEIKAVKKKKERAKELEGIDMNNIVSSFRWRSTSSYIPPPKPKIEAESDEDEEGEDEDDEDNEEDSDEGDNDGDDSGEGSGEDETEEESD